MDKQYFINLGYIDSGYFSPELSNESVYPNYIEKEVEESILKIKSQQSENTVTFAFMTDIHYSDTPNHNIRMKRLINAYKDIARNVKIDKLILGGDYSNNGCREYVKNNYKKLREHFNEIIYYPTNGNHDDNSFWDEFLESPKAENHFSKEELYCMFYDHLENQKVRLGDKRKELYYYHDDITKKVRYIHLDTLDIPEKYDEKGRFVYTKQHTFGISQKQIDWLINDALCFENDGWNVIFFLHNLTEDLKTPEKHETAHLCSIIKIADAYKEGRYISEIFDEGDFKIKIEADFSNYKRGDIIAFFGGHYHKDIHKTTEKNIPCIFSGNVIMYNGTDLERKDGQKSEILFTVITIDRIKRKICLVRVGAGEDRTIFY